MLNSTCVPKWADVQYGTPKPRFIIPLVRIDAMTQDMPKGYTIDPCFLPPTILQLDECAMLLRVNDALLDLKPLLPCLSVAASGAAPTNPPSAGYLPIHVNKVTKKLSVYAGGEWVTIV
jgi:hypothetical protein